MVYPLVKQEHEGTFWNDQEETQVKRTRNNPGVIGVTQIEHTFHVQEQSTSADQEKKQTGEIKLRLDLLTKNWIVEVLKLIESKVGGAKESFSKELNRGEHLADPSSYGLSFDDLQCN